MTMSLKALRKRIDATDKQIVALLNKRAGIIVNVGTKKSKAGTSAYCPEREREVLRNISAANHGPLTAGAL
jgi:chorismate mutase/prephenate dehydratase